MIPFLGNMISFRLHFFYSILSLFSLEAGIADHLKPALNKGNNHSFKNIDFIYMINLDKRPEKFLMSQKQLTQYGVNPYRFSAVNGWELSLEAILDVGLKYKPGMNPLLASTFVKMDDKLIVSHEFMKDYDKSYFCHCMAPGPIGCALSHISVLKDAYDSGYEIIWVMEDDIEVIRNIQILPDLIDELTNLTGKGNWDVLFTDFDYRIGVQQYLPSWGLTKRPNFDCSEKYRCHHKFTDKSEVHSCFRKMPSRFGTASMIISRSGIKKLLQFSLENDLFLPYDLENRYPQGLIRYGLMFDVVTNMLDSISDNGKPRYLEKE